MITLIINSKNKNSDNMIVTCPCKKGSFYTPPKKTHEKK